MSPPRYSLLSSLGHGGMGEVWLADDTQLGRKVAIKFLTEALENDATARERLHREARSAAALDHPFICKIHEIAKVDGRTGIVMEHVAGETLRAALDRTPFAPARALVIATEIAEALDEAHGRRLVHRDLKPANVMLTSQGHVKVMDFGLAKPLADDVTPAPDAATRVPLTGSGVRVGTPGYMAPELMLGADADARSDIFAFGILLFELLAGVHPFQRASQSGTMAAVLRDDPAPVTQYQSALPESAKATLDRMLAKEPDRRPQSAEEVRAELQRLTTEAFRQALGDAASEVAKIAPELRRVFPDISPPIELPPDQQRRFLFSTYRAFTERAAKAMPMVVVLEDLHWADEPTGLLMQHLAQHLRTLPLLIVGTYRDVELDVGRPGPG